MFYVYILRSRVAQKSYVGYTENLDNRLKEHNSGKGTFTSRYIPWDLIHAEEYLTRYEAVNRERYLKSKTGRRELKKIFEIYCPVG